MKLIRICLFLGVIFIAGCGLATDMPKVEDQAAAREQAQLGTDAMLLASRNTPSLYFGDGRTATLMWDLSSGDVIPSHARFPGLFLLDVRVTYETVAGQSLAVGYTFTNPRMQMFTGEMEVVVSGVDIRVNGALAPGTENLLSAQKTAKGIDSVNIYSGSVRTKMTAVSSGDTVGVAFTQLTLQPRTDNPPVPPQPTITVPNPFTRQTQVPIQVSGDGTARRWCLTASPVRPRSTNEPCPGYIWTSTRPTNFDLVNVGRLIASGETVQFYLWIANADLKISATAAQAQVTFDSTAPSAPALASVTVSDSQMATLDGLGNSNETVSWCVKENANQNNVQDDQGCSYSSTKPLYAGLRGGGTRFVRVFVRDRAGNTAGSTVRSANNPFGQISFAQLIDPSTGARAVFANTCSSCHGESGVNQAQWDSTSYSATVAKKAALLSRIDSGSAPMPPTGLLDEKQRALIRLWLTQTTTPVQQ
ncbi:MAG: cytochrome c [Bdellovibrionales bacterium]|nr:cytochrome c [Bdellovibrionales bacterium]